MLDEKFYLDGMKYLTSHFAIEINQERLDLIYQEIKGINKEIYQSALESIARTELAINANQSLVALINKHVDIQRKYLYTQSQPMLKEPIFRANKNDWPDFEEFYQACCEVYANYTPNREFCKKSWQSIQPNAQN
ncbi:hypothetical protein KKE18_00575 [Patescibacteria group bacterium]|nr:hypothetical protein [Patescibacteria group bacterium]MBU1844619.1 hypothetical protein [Patescibacteria group bacterium]